MHFIFLLLLSFAALTYAKNPFVVGKYLVQLKDEPVLSRFSNTDGSHSDRKKYRDKLRTKRNAFKAKLGRSIQVFHEYDLVFNGLSVEADSSQIARIDSMPEVVRIHRVANVSIPEKDFFSQRPSEEPPEKMLPTLNVPDIWKKHGVKGQGTTIAILDTGIDYTHPDLGGCFGEGCKVVGGYDVVNNDKDPMDGAGHGTHVAGIAAGKGKKLGVAPEAKLLAYKVLSDFGSGTSDQIIRGLELALDPNGDGNPSDAPDVINFSLGGLGTPEDPMAIAVNNASKHTVVVCAAGNSGTRGSVGTPAAARQSIAVGATDENKKMASFSSVGPTASFTLKPEISAPGYKIWSTMPGGKYKQLSGTSMSAPYIAGLSALIIQKYGKAGNATDFIKSKYALSAKAFPLEGKRSLVDTFLFQGHGLVDPPKTMENKFGLSLDRTWEHPSFTLDQGVHEISREWLQRTVYITFKGTVKESDTYEVSIESDLGDGAQISYSPKKLPPGNRNSIRVNIRQKTKSIPHNANYPHSRGLIVKVHHKNSGQTLRIPITLFIKAKYSIVTKRGEDLFAAVDFYPETKFASPAFFPMTNLKLTTKDQYFDAYLQPGTYTISLPGYSKEHGKDYTNFFTKKNVSIRGTNTLRISSKDLTHKKIWHFVGLNGQPSTPTLLYVKLTTPPLGPKKQTHNTYIFGTSTSVWRSNRVPDNWKNLISGLWLDNEISYFVGEPIKFNSQYEEMDIPALGYKSLQVIPNIPNVAWPVSICYRHSIADAKGRSADTLSNGSATTLATGKGELTKRMSRTIIFKHQFQEGLDNYCFHHKKTSFTSHFDTDGNAVLIGTNQKAFFTFPNPVTVGNSVPIPAGQFKLLKGTTLRAPLRVATLRFGERQSHAHPYKLLNVDTNKVIEEGQADPALQTKSFELSSGKYSLIRTGKDSKRVQVGLNFQIKEGEKEDRVLPSLRYFVWKKEGNGIRLYISYQGMGEETPNAKLMLRQNEESDWETVNIEALQGVQEVFAAKFSSNVLKSKTLKMNIENKRSEGLTLEIQSPFELTN